MLAHGGLKESSPGQIQRSRVFKVSRLARSLQFHRGVHYPPHSHRDLTTHLILRGELIITYPEDESPTKQRFGSGSRLDVEAGRVHEVWIGPAGCTYVIGE
jgi:hypothetical protein